MNNRRSGKINIISLVVVLVIIAGAFSAGTYFGYNKKPSILGVSDLINKEQGEEVSADFEPFWRIWNIVNDKYVATEKPIAQEKVWGAIAGLVDSLGDPYSVFMLPKESERFESDVMKGQFSGVGMEVGMRDGILTVIAPLKDTPAERSGILSGDKIIQIDDVSLNDMNIDSSIELIRGKRGTKVTLLVLRDGEDEPLNISITRDLINIPTINSELRDDGVFVIELFNFSANSPVLFRSALQEFVDSGSDNLIIDLRNNPGGFLESAVDIASWFLAKGKVVVSEDFGEGKEGEVYRSRGYNIFTDELKLVILVNGGSASASEILAGALSEHGKAVLVGEKTFGKGSVQELLKITSDTSLKITVARWLTPNGTSISEGGLIPEVMVEMTKEDYIGGLDPQIEKAVEYLLNKK